MQKAKAKEQNMTKEFNVEHQIKKSINNAFQSAKVKIQRQGRIIVEFRAGILPAFVSYLKEYLDFKHLVMMSCVDWMEENEFEIVYHLWSYEQKVHIMVKVRLNREKPLMQSISKLWDQAETYEREIHEMNGVDFEGHPGMRDLILEDWDDIPPMRRDFKTVDFVNETYEWRNGRENKQDVRETIAKQVQTEVPDFEDSK